MAARVAALLEWLVCTVLIPARRALMGLVTLIAALIAALVT